MTNQIDQKADDDETQQKPQQEQDKKQPQNEQINKNEQQDQTQLENQKQENQKTEEKNAQTETKIEKKTEHVQQKQNKNKKQEKKAIDVQKTLKQQEKDKMQNQHQNNQKATKDALKNGKKLIVIEVCQNCDQHNYCTHHKEEKYKKYFEDIKKAIESKFPSYYVSKNYNIQYPNIGAFEVTLDGQNLFSKLQKKRWPKVESIIHNIQRALGEDKKENHVEPQSQQKSVHQQKDKKVLKNSTNQQVSNQFKFKQFLRKSFSKLAVLKK